ncbi:MAG: hypothetical protein M3065_05230 [Actinomycetota bacterium]|nr:hypothetical protein [Actinomycetota bacterium]
MGSKIRAAVATERDEGRVKPSGEFVVLKEHDISAKHGCLPMLLMGHAPGVSGPKQLNRECVGRPLIFKRRPELEARIDARPEGPVTRKRPTGARATIERRSVLDEPVDEPIRMRTKEGAHVGYRTTPPTLLTERLRGLDKRHPASERVYGRDAEPIDACAREIKRVDVDMLDRITQRALKVRVRIDGDPRGDPNQHRGTTHRRGFEAPPRGVLHYPPKSIRVGTPERAAALEVALSHKPHPALEQRYALGQFPDRGRLENLKASLDPTPLKTIHDPRD